MKHSLPWNITGIPPEVRDVARAAAARDGVTVGEWVSRRILAEGSAPPTSSEKTAPLAGREDLATQLARAEAEAESAFRRIDDTLRNMARRLESNEMVQNDAQRAMSIAASEINAATRDQSQAFALLTQRMDRVERNADTGILRDAVRGLHQGLSRLADQIAKMANESSGQIATVAGNVETLSGKLLSARDETARLEQAVEERFGAISEQLDRVGRFEQLIEERLHALGERLKFAEERIVADGGLEQTIAAIDLRLNVSEEKYQDVIERQLVSIENNLDGVAARLEQAEERSRSGDALQENLHDLTRRFEAAERKGREAFRELKASFGENTIRLEAIEAFAAAATAAAEPEPVPLPPAEDAPAPDEGLANFDLPPFPDLPPFAADDLPSPAPRSAWVQPQPAAAIHAIAAPEPETLPHPVVDYLSQARRAAQASAQPIPNGHPPLEVVPSLGNVINLDTSKRPGRGSKPIALGLVTLLALTAGFWLTQSFGPDTESASRAVTQQLALNTPPEHTAVASVSASLAQPFTLSQEVAGAAQAVEPAPAADPLLAKAKAGDTKAELALGLRYADGGVTADDAEAAAWLQKAAQKGEALAQYRLGTLYEKGRGVPKDTKQATSWYLEAAKRGNRKAMHNLAVAYANGAGTPKSFAEAARWFKTAADLGLVDSQFNLAVLYERGLGVPASLLDAYKWYAIAAHEGDAESKTRIDTLTSQLQPAERDIAEKDAEAFQPQPPNPDANEAPTFAQLTP